MISLELLCRMGAPNELTILFTSAVQVCSFMKGALMRI